MTFFDDAFENAKQKKQGTKTEEIIIPEKGKNELMPSVDSMKTELKIMTKQALEALKESAVEFQITDKSSLDQAAEMIFQSNKIHNTVEDCRKRFGRPYLDATQAINAFAKGYTGICKGITDGLVKKRGAYIKEQDEIEEKKRRDEEQKRIAEFRKIEAEKERIHQEEMNKHREELKKAEELNKKAGKIVAIPQPPPTLPLSQTKIIEAFEKPIVPEAKKKFHDGTIKTKMIVVFEVDDIESVPHKFLMIDGLAVKESLDAGVRSIPGLIIREEIKEVFRTGRR